MESDNILIVFMASVSAFFLNVSDFDNILILNKNEILKSIINNKYFTEIWNSNFRIILKLCLWNYTKEMRRDEPRY